MRHARLLLITGLPATGKSTLARYLAREHGAPLITKDSIKEPLLDVLGAADAAASRRLSDASFAVLFGIARELISTGSSLILEGNFRPGEHEAALQAVLASPVAKKGLRVAQVLCRVDEAQRLRRLALRAGDPARHPGHRDSNLLTASSRTSDAFLDIPGDRFEVMGDGPVPEELHHWWQRIM